LSIATAQSIDYKHSGNVSLDMSHIQDGTQGYFEIISDSEGHKETLRIPDDQMLFKMNPIYDNQGKIATFSLSLDPKLNNFYHQVGMFDKPKDIVFIYPSFTQAAYGNNGFYDYYRGDCDSRCLTVNIPQKVEGIGASSILSAWELKLLNYTYVKDEDVDKNPDILKQYKRVIVLHNEYVTKKEFDAITHHPDVVFLYPNALYAEVQTNYTTNTITLVKGHGYPDSSIRNGFDWIYDNSRLEYDVMCNDWNFYNRGNYTLLNCYPEYKILTSNVMLGLLQKDDPSSLLDNVANWLRYSNDQNQTESMLDDFNINGKSVPNWVEKPALSLLNKEITKKEFANMLEYLAINNIIT
jgi:hypothetical protein